MSYSVELSYPLTTETCKGSVVDFIEQMDAIADKAAGTRHGDSGAGCGTRDLAWLYPKKTDADKCMKRLRAAKLPEGTTVKVIVWS